MIPCLSVLIDELCDGRQGGREKWAHEDRLILL